MPGDSVWVSFIKSMSGHPGWLVLAFAILCFSFIAFSAIKSPQLASALAAMMKSRHEPLEILTRVCNDLKEAVEKLTEESARQSNHRARIERIIDGHEAMLKQHESRLSECEVEQDKCRAQFDELRENVAEHLIQHAG